MEIPQKLIEYVNHNRGSLPPVTDPDEPLHLDSYGVIRTVAFLENDLGYRVKDEDMRTRKLRDFAETGRVTCNQTANRPDTRRLDFLPGRVFPRFWKNTIAEPVPVQGSPSHHRSQTIERYTQNR